MMNRIVHFLLCIKNLFVTHPKRAHVLKCHTCGSTFWGKTKIHYPEKICPNCESKSSVFIPSDVSIKEREKMWRFLDEQDKEDRDELDHHELMEEKYANVWHLDNPGFLHEISEKIRENLR